MIPATHSRRPDSTLPGLVFYQTLCPSDPVPGEELDPLTSTHLVYAIICYVRDLAYIFEIRSRIEIMRVSRLGDR
jgi:hypothetical protein